MNLGQISSPKTILALITVLFLAKGLLLGFLMPIFQNPDEQIHYGTIQHWAESKDKTSKIQTLLKEFQIDPNDIRTTNLPEETVQSAFLSGFDQIKFESQNIPNFSNKNTEGSITENSWRRSLDAIPSAVSGTKSIYYFIASWIERALSNESIFVRIFSSRMLAVAFGVGTVLLAYLIVRKIGFSGRTSLLFTALVAFQPMFSITAAQVNIDIALIFSFTLFLYVGSCILKNGLNGKNAMMAVLAAILGILSKGPGIVLIVALFPLFVWGAYQRFQIPKKRFFIWLTIVTIILIGLVLLIVPKSYLVSITNSTALSKFHSPAESIGEYLHKTLGQKELRDTARSYWGNFGWLDNAIPGWMLSIIRIIEAVGFFGVFWYLLTPVLPTRLIPAPMRNNDQPDWLPRRQYIIFFLGMIIALQCAIRFYDWRIFDNTGQILIGQPGRYFLPNLVGHLVIVVTGIGFLVRQEKYFMFTLKILALAMILLQWYAIIDIILPRYYL